MQELYVPATVTTVLVIATIVPVTVTTHVLVTVITVTNNLRVKWSTCNVIADNIWFN